MKKLSKEDLYKLAIVSFIFFVIVIITLFEIGRAHV